MNAIRTIIGSVIATAFVGMMLWGVPVFYYCATGKMMEF